jgi:hypothetical protein
MQARVDVFLFDDGTSITGTPGVDSLDDVDSLNLFRFFCYPACGYATTQTSTSICYDG